jgi:hypothetical protein
MNWSDWLVMKGFQVIDYPGVNGWLVYAPGCTIGFRTADLADFGKKYARCHGYNV